MHTNETLAQGTAAPEIKSVRAPAAPQQRAAGSEVDLGAIAAEVRAGSQVIAALGQRAAAAAPRISEIKGTVQEIRARRTHQLRETAEQDERETRAGRRDPLRQDQLRRLNQDIDAAGDQQIAELKQQVRDLQLKLRRPLNPNGQPAGAADHKKAAQLMHKQAAMHYIRTGETQFKGRTLSQWEQMAAPGVKAMHEGNNPSGGALLIGENDMTIERMLAQVVPMRQFANVVNITSHMWSKRVRTKLGGAKWGNELAGTSGGATPEYAIINLPAHNLYADPTVSGDLLADSAYPVEAEIMDGATEDFMVAENPAFITGTGVEQPQGFLGYASGTYAAGTNLGHAKIGYSITGQDGGFAASGSADAILKLPMNLKQQYRQNAKYLLNRITLGACRTLKDGSGRYVWVDGDIVRGVPSTLNGYPVGEAEQMPDYTTTGAFAVAFADWKRFYTIVDRDGMTVLRDPYSAKPSVVFFCTKRVGGGVVNFEAGTLLKFSAS